MDDAAIQRLRAAKDKAGLTAKQISQSHGWSETYVSRILNNEIKKPDPMKLLLICQDLDVDMTYILTGELVGDKRKILLEEIAEAPQAVIDQISDFVRKQGLNRD